MQRRLTQWRPTATPTATSSAYFSTLQFSVVAGQRRLPRGSSGRRRGASRRAHPTAAARRGQMLAGPCALKAADRLQLSGLQGGFRQQAVRGGRLLHRCQAIPLSGQWLVLSSVQCWAPEFWGRKWVLRVQAWLSQNGVLCFGCNGTGICTPPFNRKNELIVFRGRKTDCAKIVTPMQRAEPRDVGLHHLPARTKEGNPL